MWTREVEFNPKPSVLLSSAALSCYSAGPGMEGCVELAAAFWRRVEVEGLEVQSLKSNSGTLTQARSQYYWVHPASLLVLEPVYSKNPWFGVVGLGFDVFCDYSSFLCLAMPLLWAPAMLPGLGIPPAHSRLSSLLSSPLVIGFVFPTWPWQLAFSLFCSTHWLFT